MRQLSAIQRDLLYALVGLNRPNGQELKAELEQRYGGPVSDSSLYHGLNKLTEAGFVEKKQHNSERSFTYIVTKAGKQRVDSQVGWISQFQIHQSDRPTVTND